MAFNPRGSFTLDLSLFGSWVQDIQPTDLPAGASPDNSDCFYLPGGVFTRPALKKVLATPIPESPTILSVKDFPAPSGDSLAMLLDSNGLLHSNDAADPADTTTLATVTAGVQFKAETAFNKQWYALFSALESAAFSQNPFVGVDPPMYYNGTTLFRVTSDAPGASPSFANIQTSPAAIVQTTVSGSLSLNAAISAGSGPPWTHLSFEATTTVPADWLGQTVTTSGFSGTNDYLANQTGVITFISANTFDVSLFTYSQVILTGQSGTATLTGNYLSRQNNIVTAYFGSALPVNTEPGFWASVMNSDASLINGPSWTIASISRDANGLVTVTISTQLTNLPVGAQLYVASNDTTDFPNGYQTVSSALYAAGGTTVFTYTSLNTAVASDTSGGSVYQTWSPQSGTYNNAAQVLASGYDATNGWYIQYFQLGPDTAIDSTGGTPQAQVVGQIPGGLRSGIVFFESADGAQTAPSVPIQFSAIGGNNLLFVSQIPIGPFGTAKRVIALTPAEGSSWYYISPAQIPSIGGLSPVIATGTEINDNVTSSAILDFSDAQLTAGTQIDIPGNNLFNQVVLAPCLGNIEYEGRMCWWGEINNVKNFLNMGFDGGYLPPLGELTISGYNEATWVSGSEFQQGWSGSMIVISGTAYQINSVTNYLQMILETAPSPGTYPFTVLNPAGTQPPGWAVLGTAADGTLVSYPEVVDIPGFAYRMQGDIFRSLAAPHPQPIMIEQGCVTDYYGGPILQSGIPYIARLKAMSEGSPLTGNLIISIVSPSQNIFYQSAVFSVASLSASGLAWVSADFTVYSAPVTGFAPDTVLRISLSAVPSTTFITIDELEIIYADQPVSYDQMRLSYYQNPFGFDGVSGVMSVDPSENIAGAFRQRGYLYILSDQSLFQSVNNGTTEPDGWDVTQYVGACGCSGPNAVDFGEEVAYWAGRYGGRAFTGDPTAKKITQEWAETWESINWNAQTTIWVKNDPVDRLLFFGIPTNGAAMPNKVVHMSYRLSDAAYNVPDPVHVSAYTGKMIVTDLGRRWSPWQLAINSADMCTRPLLGGGPGVAKTIVFAGGNGQSPGAAPGFGNLYLLDTYDYWPLNPSLGTWNCADDDYGAIDSYYTTYFWFNHDMEQQPLLGSDRKIFNYVRVHATGVGSLQVTPYIDSLTKPQRAFPMPPLSLADPGYDIEFHPITKGQRVAYKLAPYIGAPGIAKAMAITHMIVSAHKDLVFPVRGTIFGG